MTDLDDGIEAEAARWFFASSEDVFVILQQGVIQRVNPAWTALTGWEGPETDGNSFERFGHPEDREVLEGIVNDLRQHGHAQAEHRLSRKSGGWVWVKSRSRLNPQGVALVMLQDITEDHRRALEAEEDARTTDLLREEAGVIVWNFDAVTRLYCLDSDRLRAGDVGVQGRRKLSPEEMTAEIHPDDREAISLAFMQTMATGAPLVVEYRHFRAEDGGWARLRAAWRGSHQAANGLWNIVGITHDISPLAEARDAALAAAEVKAQFLANMSHEIRTPMNGVLGVLHLLKRERLSEDGRRLLEEALGCGAMLSELLNDVIDFSRIESGKVDLTPQPLDPAGLLNSVVALLRPQAEAKGLSMRTSVPTEPGWVNVDPVRLRQILFNLLGNAVKFTVEGGVSATLSVSGEGQAQRLRIDIADTGIGIDADAQTALFDRFQQADGTTTRRFGGSGLGLAIARGLAQQMGGDIGLISAPGQGSTFWVEIASPAAQPPAQLCAPMEPGEDLLAGVSVLVVEDNATNRLIATRLLEQLGARVTTAPDGAEGLAAAAVEAFDLIFMDIQMPVMDGLKATTGIRRMSGPNATAPILAMTANAMTHQIDSYLAAGMNGWVSKPLSPNRLVEAILRVLTEAESQAVA